MNLESLIPSLGHAGLAEKLERGEWHVDHGPIARFPEFLQPDSGALGNINKLANWRHFDIGYKDRGGKYNQTPASGLPALSYYEMGALVRSSAIDEASEGARRWLDDWASVLGVARGDLRLNSWAVRGPNGIHWHFDPEDVIHFQIKGDKLLKFLPSDATRGADAVMKRGEKFYTMNENFHRAEGRVVREGTITIIPRGVWHWSESQSDESFAVSLCVNPPSYASMVTQSLYKKLRLLEESRGVRQGDVSSQQDALEECLKAAREMLAGLSGESILVEERRKNISVDKIDKMYFHASQFSKVELQPTLRLMIGDRVLAFEGSSEHDQIVGTVVKRGTGFYVEDLYEDLAGISRDGIREVIASLFRVGFLETTA